MGLHRLHRGLWLVALSLLAGCARDPQMVAWEGRLGEVERKADRRETDAAIAGFTRLQRSALNKVDPQLLTMRKAWTYERAGKYRNAITLYEHVAKTGLRRMDRARARYMIARMVEERGHLAKAVKMYRQLALVYPSLMPGLRGLAHTKRLLYARGPKGVHAHLSWMLEHYPRMEHTQLGDNFVHAAAFEARRRAFALPRGSKAQREMAALAEELYGRIHDRYYKTGLWMQSMWELSYLYHWQERWRDELEVITRILRSKEGGGLFGDTGHAYHSLSEWREARLHQKQLKDPAEAARVMQRFLDKYPLSRYRDDARFYEGCAWLQAGRKDLAEETWARIKDEYKESKFLRRLDKARTEPQGTICDMPIKRESDG